MRHHRTLALLIAFLASGCYREPQIAEILVNTTPPGASCVVSQRGHPLGVAEPTPAIAIVNLVGGEIGVTCRRPGFLDAAVAVPSPPAPAMPGFVPRSRPEIEYQTRVDITMLPLPPEMRR